MIEINLLEQKKPVNLQFGGIDLRQINIKGYFVAIIIWYLPGMLLYGEWENERKSANEMLSKLQTKLRKVSKEVRANKHIKVKLDAYNKQVKDLEKRSEQVRKIIRKRTNPKMALERIARNLPEDMWLNDLEIKEDKSILINGMTYSFRSMSNFLTLANESSFFGKTLEVTDTKTIKETGRNKSARIEKFAIKGRIVLFNPSQ